MVMPAHPRQRVHRGHQSVVIDAVEKFGQVNIYDEPIAFDDVGLRLRHAGRGVCRGEMEISPYLQMWKPIRALCPA